MSLLKKIIFTIPLFLLCTFSADATDISVNGVHKYFEFGKKPIQNLVVTNNDKKRTFSINLEMERIVSVDAKTGKVVLEPAPDDFMFAPRAFVLQPGERRNLRAVYVKGFDENEKLYRLSFSPRVQERLSNDEEADGITFGTSMVTVVGVAVMVAPVKKDVNLVFERTKDGVVFKNAGNVTTVLRPRVEHCSPTECITIRRKEMNPGDVWFFAMPEDMSFKWYYDVYEKTQNKPLIINAY